MTSRTYFRRFIADVAATAPGRATLCIVLMTISSSFEGIALAMLFPLLSLLGFGGQGELSGLTTRINAVISDVGLTANIYTAAAVLLVMVVLQQIAFLMATWIAAGLQATFMVRWREQLIDAFLRTEWLHFAHRNAGDLSHVLNTETRRASYLFNYSAIVMALSLTALVYLIVAFVASWKVTSVLIIGGAAILALSQFLVPKPGLLTKQQTELYTRFSSQSSEVLGGMKLVRAINGGEAIRRSLWPLIRTLGQVERRVFVQPAILRACFEVLAVSALMGTLVLSVDVLGSDGATVVLIAALFVRLYPRVATIQQSVHEFRIGLPYYGVVTDTLDQAIAEAEPNSQVQADPGRPVAPPAVSLIKVSVNYNERAALHDVSLVIPSRQTVAIVGPSGAGKSTLVDTLLRLVPVSAGRIEIDGVDLNDIDLGAWRRSVGYVPQDTFLFNATVRENIAFAQPQASIGDIREAARKAQLLSFVDSLPDGFETIVGDRGILLSGGQRQRLGIARALVGGKAILILDEATAALDSETEAAIVQDLSILHGQITIIMIAHRLSTLRAADKIFVLEKGRLIEAGSWTTLMASGGLFQKLWGMQTAAPYRPRVAQGN